MTIASCYILACRRNIYIIKHFPLKISNYFTCRMHVVFLVSMETRNRFDPLELWSCLVVRCCVSAGNWTWSSTGAANALYHCSLSPTHFCCLCIHWVGHCRNHDECPVLYSQKFPAGLCYTMWWCHSLCFPDQTLVAGTSDFSHFSWRPHFFWPQKCNFYDR